MEESGILCASSVPEDVREGIGGGVIYGSRLAADPWAPFLGLMV